MHRSLAGLCTPPPRPRQTGWVLFQFSKTSFCLGMAVSGSWVWLPLWVYEMPPPRHWNSAIFFYSELFMSFDTCLNLSKIVALGRTKNLNFDKCAVLLNEDMTRTSAAEYCWQPSCQYVCSLPSLLGGKGTKLRIWGKVWRSRWKHDVYQEMCDALHFSNVVPPRIFCRMAKCGVSHRQYVCSFVGKGHQKQNSRQSLTSQMQTWWTCSINCISYSLSGVI